MSDVKQQTNGANVTKKQASLVIDNRWRALRKYTDARIALGRAGVSQPTSHQLEFQLAHACAQDAVHQAVDWVAIERSLYDLGIPLIKLNTRVTDRQNYLQRPDLGRRLNTESADSLVQWKDERSKPMEVCVVIADGLSATAVQQQSIPMVRQLVTDLNVIGLRCSTVCLVSQGRVAIGDEISQILKSRFVVVLIGERPGLSAFDSLGIYFTFRAQIGCSDSHRNCISNIRPKGLSFVAASQRLTWLIKESDRLELSGVALKDDSYGKGKHPLDSKNDSQSPGNFLILKPA